MLGLRGPAVSIFIPVGAPVVGIGGANPLGDLVQSIHDKRGKVTRIGGRCVVQRSADLHNIGMAVGGITADHLLAVTCPDEIIAPADMSVSSDAKSSSAIAGLLARESGEPLDVVVCPSGFLRVARS